MSTIHSKIDDLDKLQFEPFSAKPVSVFKMCQVGQTVVALGSNGTIYSTGVQKRIAYSCHGASGSIARTLDACVKLGVLTAKAVKEHKANVAAVHKMRDDRYRAQQFMQYAKDLNITLTGTQSKKLSVLGATK